MDCYTKNRKDNPFKWIGDKMECKSCDKIDICMEVAETYTSGFNRNKIPNFIPFELLVELNYDNRFAKHELSLFKDRTFYYGCFELIENDGGCEPWFDLYAKGGLFATFSHNQLMDMCNYSARRLVELGNLK